jgi:hypothetical protein
MLTVGHGLHSGKRKWSGILNRMGQDDGDDDDEESQGTSSYKVRGKEMPSPYIAAKIAHRTRQKNKRRCSVRKCKEP